MTHDTTGSKVSGQKLAGDLQDSGLSPSLQNFSPFASGWREKRFMEMTAEEVDLWFAEMTLLVLHDGLSM